MHRIFSFLLTFFFSRKEKSLCAFFVTFFAQAKKVKNKNIAVNINLLFIHTFITIPCRQNKNTLKAFALRVFEITII